VYVTSAMVILTNLSRNLTIKILTTNLMQNVQYSGYQIFTSNNDHNQSLCIINNNYWAYYFNYRKDFA